VGEEEVDGEEVEEDEEDEVVVVVAADGIAFTTVGTGVVVEADDGPKTNNHQYRE
jgi:hypothetical protein